MKKAGLKKHKRNIGIIAAFLVAIVLFNQVPADASVTDNIQNCVAAILGHVDDKLSGTFEKSSTNGKLNQMKTDVDAVNTSLDQLISPYMSSLTVWVNDSNTAYNGMQVSITDSKGKVKTAGSVARNGHYEADFGNILRGNYTISYPYIVSGKTMKFSISSTLNAGGNRKQLYGNIFQMSMTEIQNMCKAGIIHQMVHVGDTISDGTYTYTIIGINQDKPSDESGNLLPESSYGDVLTLMPLGALVGASNGQPVTVNRKAMPWDYPAQMNSSDTSLGGWKSTDMRKITMPQYLAKLPAETQNVIGYVKKISGRPSSTDSTDYENGSSNVITGDKCFLLSEKEILGYARCATGNEGNATFQYQYFKSIAKSDESRCLVLFSWLRSAYYGNTDDFTLLYTVKELTCAWNASTKAQVLPAFCIY